MPQNVTDISDKTWDDLHGADRAVLQELASERDGIDGRKGNEALAAALLAHDGREDDIPDEYAEEYVDEIEAALAAREADEERAEDDGYETQVADDEPEPDDDGDDEEPAEPPTADDRELDDDEDEEEANDAKLGTEGSHKLTREASFIIEADTLEAWLDNADVLVDECRIHVEDDGLRIVAVDAANVAMVTTSLQTRAFESYTTAGEGVIGVNLERLVDIVTAPDAGELVHIEYDPEARNLVVTFGGHEFRMALIDAASIRKEPDVPDLDLPVRLEVEEAQTLYDAISWADSVSDHVAFGATGDTFHVEAEGDTDSYHGTFEDREEVRFIDYGEARSLFSMDYLKDIRKAWDKNEPVELTLGEEFPCEIHQLVTADDAEVGEATFLLAPRIQSD